MSLTLNLDDVALRKGHPAGTIRAERADGSSVHIAFSENWDKAGSRASFVRKVAEKLHPDPPVVEGAAAVDPAAAATVERDRKRDARELEDLLGRELDAFHAEKAKLVAERDASPPPPSPGVRPAFQSDLPVILIGTDEHRVVANTVSALAKDEGLYHRGGMLVRVVEHQEVGSLGPPRPVIQPLPTPNLRERMTRFAAFTRFNKKGDEVAAHPPEFLVRQVDARGEWPGIRPLTGISDTPVLRPDGTLVQRPGYDRATGVLYQPAGTFPAVHPEVGIEEATESVERLLDVVRDFGFDRPEHRSAWLSGLLTPLGRYAFEGPAPLHLVDGNRRGVGKGLLVQTIGRTVLGRDMPVSIYSRDPEELRKSITATAIAGERLVVFDNVAGTLGDPVLDAMVTSTRWSDRVLGKSEKPDLPLTTCWYATGNNVQIGGDLARRTIHTRLVVLEEKPEHRTGFARPNLLRWIGDQRPALVADALTVLVAYVNAGRPDPGLVPLGSFEGWSGLVRGAVVWAGQPDPCETQRRLIEDADLATDTIGQLLGAWEAYHMADTGVLVADMLGRLYPEERQYTPHDDASKRMRAALEGIVVTAGGRAPNANQIGNKLKSFTKQVVGGRYLEKDEKGNRGTVWRLRRKEPHPS